MNIIKKSLSGIIMLFICVVSTAQENISALLPIPCKAEQRSGKMFNIAKSAVTRNDCEESQYLLKELTNIVKERTGIEIAGNRGKNRIEIVISEDKRAQEYSIEIDAGHLRITGGSEAGGSDHLCDGSEGPRPPVRHRSHQDPQRTGLAA